MYGEGVCRNLQGLIASGSKQESTSRSIGSSSQAGSHSYPGPNLEEHQRVWVSPSLGVNGVGTFSLLLPLVSRMFWGNVLVTVTVF